MLCKTIIPVISQKQCMCITVSRMYASHFLLLCYIIMACMLSYAIIIDIILIDYLHSIQRVASSTMRCYKFVSIIIIIVIMNNNNDNIFYSDSTHHSDNLLPGLFVKYHQNFNLGWSCLHTSKTILGNTWLYSELLSGFWPFVSTINYLWTSHVFVNVYLGNAP